MRFMAFRSFIAGVLWVVLWPATAAVHETHTKVNPMGAMATPFETVSVGGSVDHGQVCCHSPTGPRCQSARRPKNAVLPFQRQPEPDQEQEGVSLCGARYLFFPARQTQSAMSVARKVLATTRPIYLTTLRFRL